MSKLAFPRHGGVLIPDDARLVRTERYQRGGTTATIKIFSRHRGFASETSYHVLVDGEVTSGSFQHRDVEESLRRAKLTVTDGAKRRRLQKKLNSMSDEQRGQYASKKKLASAVEFFTRMSNGDAEVATKLALAEQSAIELGWHVDWVPDEEPYEMGDAETEPPSEVFVAVLRTSDGATLNSLGGIGDPDNNYRRLVEAELAHEQL